MQNIPTLSHDQRFPSQSHPSGRTRRQPPKPSTNWTTFESTRSTRRKKIAAIVAITKTVMVAVPVSRRVAQEIRLISWRTCLTNCAGDVFAMVDRCRYKFPKSPATPRPDAKSDTPRGSFPTMCRFRLSSDLCRYRGGCLAKRTHHGNRVLTGGDRNFPLWSGLRFDRQFQRG